jgi:4-amino-4-deoxy-L-arabinose transferase-like glycosyltransferase
MWLLLVGFLLVSGVVNPARESGSWSDDFAYARMVRHTLETGKYQLDHWAAADLPVQTYLAATLAKGFGYSLALLRMSTLLLMLAGLMSFYLLLRHAGTGDVEAGLLSVTLLASPLVLYLSFTFMTDAQFLSWLLIAFLFYSWGIEQSRVAFMALGSGAAAAAIGTRQFGIALIAGLLLTWLTGRSRRKKAMLYLIGLILPSSAGAWQLALGLTQPSATQVARLGHTLAYLHRGLPTMLVESVYRFAVLLEYLGLFLLPLIPLLLVCSIRSVRERAGERWPLWRALARVAITSLGLVGFYALSYYWAPPGRFVGHSCHPSGGC